jgi:excisionase family DNA binding protein
MSSDLMTVAAAAQRLGLHEASVRRMIARGELPAVRVGRLLRVSPAAIDALVALAEGRPNMAAPGGFTMDGARGRR